MLKKLANSENVINYDYLSYKVYFSEENSIRFHKIGFSKEYGTLYDLLDDLLISKITIDNANDDQITFVIDLMHGYDKNDLFDEKTDLSVEKGKFRKSKVLIKANNFFLIAKYIQETK